VLSITFSSSFAIHWPYIAIPFSYSSESGFFFSSDKNICFYEHSSIRTALFSPQIFSVSSDKKTIRLNGKKLLNNDITALSKNLIINDIFSCDFVHCIADGPRIKGFFGVSRKNIKKHFLKQQSAIFSSLNSTIEQWHECEQKIISSCENSFALFSQKKEMIVRVLLSKISHMSSGEWKFASEKGFWVYSIGLNNIKKSFYTDTLLISVKKGHLFCNGKKINHGIKVEPLCNYAECNDIVYDGSFCIIPENNTFLCINHVDLEDYIVSVLHTESWPGWPLEVNKAFAITCRSYVASKIFEARKKKKLFHVKNTNVHQTYKGKHDIAVLKQAVKQTKGIVLGFNKEPILAMFDSCCGGIIPAYIDNFDFNKVPYLARNYACTHCQKCSLYSWIVAYDLYVFEELMKKYNKEISTLYDVRVVKKDKAGLVSEIQLKSKKGLTTLSGKQLYSLLKEVKSFYFDINKKSGIITVSGRGFGHHLGLCQWGARQMVRDGWDYKSILRYYYPQTYFMKLI